MEAKSKNCLLPPFIKWFSRFHLSKNSVHIFRLMRLQKRAILLAYSFALAEWVWLRLPIEWHVVLCTVLIIVLLFIHSLIFSVVAGERAKKKTTTFCSIRDQNQIFGTKLMYEIKWEKSVTMHESVWNWIRNGIEMLWASHFYCCHSLLLFIVSLCNGLRIFPLSFMVIWMAQQKQLIWIKSRVGSWFRHSEM